MRTAPQPVSRGLAFALLVLPAWVLLSGCGTGEPSFEGRPASYWREQMKHSDEMARTRAIVALDQMGPDLDGAVPLLREALHDRSEYVRWKAASALRRYGLKAREAVPDLREVAAMDENPIVRQTAAETLKRIDR